MKPNITASPVSRRKGIGRAGTVAASFFVGATSGSYAGAEPRSTDDVARLVGRTRFIDTHEHLVEEDRRTGWTKPEPRLPCNDWALLFSHYLNSDLHVAGLSATEYAEFIGPETSSERKWALLEPHWLAVKNTGYGRAVRWTIERLYDVDELNRKTIRRVAERYARLVQPGFYATVLQEHAGVASCQVNSLEAPFMESRQPLLLMQENHVAKLSVID